MTKEEAMQAFEKEEANLPKVYYNPHTRQYEAVRVELLKVIEFDGDEPDAEPLEWEIVAGAGSEYRVEDVEEVEE